MHGSNETPFAAQLHAVSDQSPAATEFLLLDDGSALTDLVLVREVPQKRYVYRGNWSGQNVYIKLFVGKNSGYYANRDLTGVRYLLQAEIATPPLLFHGRVQDGRGEVLIFAEVADAKNAEEIWQACDAQQRFELAHSLVQTLALHHQAGLIQTDLYFKNFLVQQAAIYTLDGDGIRHLPRLFRKRQRLANLATLFSKMDVLDDRWIHELYRLYCQQLNVDCDVSDQVAVQLQTQKIRSRMASAYADQKVFRTCTDVKVSKRFDQFLAVARDFAFGPVSHEFLDSLLANRETNIKNGNTCTVSSATIGGCQVVIKRYNIKNFWHGLNRALRMSRAAVSWANAHRLLISDIATPKPLALLEQRFGPLRRCAYFLSEYVEAPDAMQFFASKINAEDKKTAAANIARLFYRLYLFRYSHGDFKASNIKLVNLEPVLIDLDAMQAHRCAGSFERRHIRDLRRFMLNWVHDAETTALLKRALRAQYTAQGDAKSARVAENVLIRAGIA